MTTTLETISGIQARIFNLPSRPPFMIAADLAEIYGTTVRRINEAVKRNPARFPDHYMFALSEAETAHLRSQNATTNTISTKVRYDPIVFTHSGANMLSGVLKSPVADEMAVAINDAFTAMEAKAIAEVKYLLEKTRDEIRHRRSILGRIASAGEHGWNFEMLAQSVYLSKPKLVLAIQDALNLGLITKAPDGTPFEKAPDFIDPRQMGLFPNG